MRLPKTITIEGERSDLRKPGFITYDRMVDLTFSFYYPRGTKEKVIETCGECGHSESVLKDKGAETHRLTIRLKDFRALTGRGLKPGRVAILDNHLRIKMMAENSTFKIAQAGGAG